MLITGGRTELFHDPSEFENNLMAFILSNSHFSFKKIVNPLLSEVKVLQVIYVLLCKLID